MERAQGIYAIEIVVFERLDPSDLAAETWPETPQRVATEGLVDLTSGGGAFTALSPGARALHGVWAELRRAGNLRPVAHLAWSQPGWSSGRARAGRVRIQGTGGETLLEGTLRLHRSRYLHLTTDLVFTPPGAPGGGYRLAERRQMRSRELHYIDHPAFGLLVMARPWGTTRDDEPPPADSDEPAARPTPLPSATSG